jgi:hypothetical protein
MTINPSQSVFASIGADVQPDSIEASRIHPDSSSSSQYQTVNEISEEARALIALWERNVRSIDHEPYHSSDQLRGMQASWNANGINSVSGMPPPMRYRRVLKKAFIG